MIYIKISSGLGNQLFQYAFYESLISRGKEVKLDLSYFKNKNNIDNRKFNLLEMFNVNLKIANSKEIFLYNYFYKYIAKIFKLIGLKYKKYLLINGLDSIKYYEDVLSIDNSYLDGYWQSEKYFEDIKEIIKNKLTFRSEFLFLMKNYNNFVNVQNCVSIHVRRGDYVGNNFFYQLAETNYYENAIDCIKSKIQDPKFLVFSDDINWCKNRFRNHDFTYISTDTEFSDLVDFYLMTCCQHNIIANSSFSWWAAWLNRFEDKIIFSPKIWFNNHLSTYDLIPESWTKLPVN